MRTLTLIHRWLGVAFCLLFAMWFASGIVMHFVPFPALTDAERLEGLAVLDLAGAVRGPGDAAAASRIENVTRVRQLQRPDGAIYVVMGGSGMAALRAADLSDAAVHSGELALAIAADFARRRHMDTVHADVADLAPYDQWTVGSGFDSHRPLYRIALNDSLGTELYVSSRTGEVVLETARRQRMWNYLGSVAHWIYPTVLRSHPTKWTVLVWWLSLLTLIGAGAGAVLGISRIGAEGSRLVSPYGGMQAWHHWLGLACMVFVLTWMLSGWLSMDGGLMFSTGQPAAAETMSIAGAPSWIISRDEIEQVAAPAREIEWFAFAGRIYRRERVSVGEQRLFQAGSERSQSEFLQPADIDAAASHLGRGCNGAFVVGRDDRYAVASTMPNAPVYRVVCGADWFDIDSASGAVLEKLDSSRRVYRWLYSALHTLNFPVLMAHPLLRTFLIVLLCGLGFAFSLTGVAIAWRRVLLCVRPSG